MTTEADNVERGDESGEIDASALTAALIAEAARVEGEAGGVRVAMARTKSIIRDLERTVLGDRGKLDELFATLNARRHGVQDAILQAVHNGAEPSSLFVPFALASDRESNVSPARIAAIELEAARLATIREGEPLIINVRGDLRTHVANGSVTYNRDNFTIPARRVLRGAVDERPDGVYGGLDSLVHRKSGSSRYVPAHNISFGNEIFARNVAESVERNNNNMAALWVLALANIGLSPERIGMSPDDIAVMQKQFLAEVMRPSAGEAQGGVIVQALFRINAARHVSSVAQDLYLTLAEGLRRIPVEAGVDASATRSLSALQRERLKEKVRVILSCMTTAEPTATAISSKVNYILNTAGYSA